MPKQTPKTKKPKLVKFTIDFKNPDLPEAFAGRNWGECGEYYHCAIAVDANTGKGTVAFRKMGSAD